MKKAIIIIFFSSFLVVYSQGFDWHYSSRLPFELPKLYFGINTSYNYNMNYLNEFPVYQPSQDNELVFNYGNINDLDLSFGLVGEYWILNNTAVMLKINVNLNNNEFINNETVPIDANTNWETQQVSNYNMIILSFSQGIKRRINSTFINYGFVLNTEFIINQNLSSIERSVFPIDRTFINGEKEIESDFLLPKLSTIKFKPEIFVSYDYSIAIGYYLSPFISVGYQLGSNFVDNEWTYVQFQFGFNILRAY